MIDLATLLDNGDVVPIDDKSALRLRIEPTEVATVDDFGDVYGTCGEWHDYKRSFERPVGFDGAARKLHTRTCWAWWQPPADCEDVTALYRIVRDLANYGFNGIGLELLQGEDAYKRPIVVDARWTGGIALVGSRDAVVQMIATTVADLAQDLLGSFLSA